jgi:hypothetical protein
MSRDSVPKGHAGTTKNGHTRDLKIERLDNVTIYKRGRSYFH